LLLRQHHQHPQPMRWHAPLQRTAECGSTI
jgi:hypothetical protein